MDLNGETKTKTPLPERNKNDELKEKFTAFGQQRQMKLAKKLKTLKFEQEQRQKQILGTQKMMKQNRKEYSNPGNSDEDTNEDDYWVVDTTTCSTSKQKCVLFHIICFFLGAGMLYGAIELALRGLPSRRNGGELIPILMGVVGGMILLHSCRKLYKDVRVGLCPCQEVLNRKSELDRKAQYDLENSISQAHARANQLNRQAMKLPTVGDVEARLANSNVDDGGTGAGEEKEEVDATYSSEGSYYSTASDDTSSDDEGGKTNSKPPSRSVAQKKKTSTTPKKLNEQRNTNSIEDTHETKTSRKVSNGWTQEPTKKTKRNSFTMDGTSSSDNEEDQEIAGPPKRITLPALKNDPLQNSLDFNAFKKASAASNDSDSKNKKKKKKKKKKKNKHNKEPRKPGQLAGMIPTPSK